MKKRMIPAVIACWLTALTGSFGQTSMGPKIGKPCPDFRLDRVTHYAKDKVSLDDFAGKWLILDFWFTGCGACISSLPKLNRLQHDFRDDIQFLLVGLNEGRYGRDVVTIYEKMKKKLDLNLAVAYDSALFERWQIQSMPQLIIIDPAGTVRMMTDGRDMTAEKLKLLIDGEAVTFYSNDNIGTESEALPSAPGKDKLLYGSTLSRWNNETQYAPLSIARYVEHVDSTGFKIVMVPLYALYNYAYIGQWDWFRKDSLYRVMYPVPILDMQDSSLFEFDYTHQVGKGTYNYRLTIPKEKADPYHIMEIMQQDLKNTFGFDVTIETRPVPVWSLTATPGARKKLRSRGGPVVNSLQGDSSGGAAGFSFKNVPVVELMGVLTRFLGYPPIPCFDDTGITLPIDITIDAIMSDFNDLKRALNRNGLDIEKRKKEMRVLVISERTKT